MAQSLSATASAASAAATLFNIHRDYSGQNFFNGWDFYGSWDNLTLSNAFWVDETNATSQHLAYVNDAGQAILRVDNTTTVAPGDNITRNTVRITSTDSYDFGSLWVFDSTHLPYGCSVWPAFWTKGPNWPEDGEIDIMEAINLQTTNQMAVHTSDGCTLGADTVQTGEIGSDDCASNSGCTVAEKNENSYGAGFNQIGGGVWATQFDTTGINIWFWSRPDIPAALTSNASAIDISSWGTPSASFPAGANCPTFKDMFTPQQIVIDIALCGVWAGVDSIYQHTCDGTCVSVVSGTGSPAYDEAYFEINYVRAYTTGPPLPPPTPSSSTTSGPASATTTASTKPSAEPDTSGARRIGGSAGAAALILSVLGMLVLS